MKERVTWPKGSKCAFNLGFDLDGETIWRNKARKLPGGEGFLKGPSIGAYGPKKGAARILEVLKEFELKATWFIPAVMIEEHQEIVEKILAEGHEIAHHGLDHTGRYGASLNEQQEYIGKCQETFLNYTGRLAYGIRPTGALLPETEKWLYREGGFRYSSAGTSGEGDGYYCVDGERTEGINIPCRDEQMDDYVQTVFHNYPAVLEGMPRIAAYDVVYDNWIREVCGMAKAGNCGSSAFHPQIAGTPGRAVMLEKFCAYLAKNQEVWCATCLEIADYCRKNLPGGGAAAQGKDVPEGGAAAQGKDVPGGGAAAQGKDVPEGGAAAQGGDMPAEGRKA